MQTYLFVCTYPYRTYTYMYMYMYMNIYLHVHVQEHVCFLCKYILTHTCIRVRACSADVILPPYRVLLLTSHITLSSLCFSEDLEMRKLALEVKQKTAEEKAMEAHRRKEDEVRRKQYVCPSVRQSVCLSVTLIEGACSLNIYPISICP